jgi:hypothetical protein
MMFPAEKKMASEPEMAGEAEMASEPEMASGADMAGAELSHEDTAAEPAGVAYAPPPAQIVPPAPPGARADPGAPARAAGNGAVDAVADNRWSKIQAMFVDDPHDSVAKAAGLVDEAIEAFITTVRERQASMASSWQTEGADTEQLRAAFRGYRAFWNSVTELSQPA